MAFQFMHVETYSRKADKAGRSTSFVFDEASREPHASRHVERPGVPEVVHGIDLAELRDIHDAGAAAATSTNANGKVSKIRVDQHTLLTAIASHPATCEQMRADPAVAVQVDDWQRRNIEWMRETWGDRLVSVVRHTDEAHPHLHAYVLPDGPMRARELHPGVAAKTEAKAQALQGGSDAKTANKFGDDAYKAAMRALQDSYWERVGLPCGLARVGPGVRRLSRAGWQQEKHVASVAGQLVRTAEAAQSEVAQARKTVDGAAERLAAAAVAEERARDAARRARKAIEHAREQVFAARQAADAAEARRMAEERKARQASAAAKGVVAQAQHRAGEILISAAAEAEAMRRRVGGFGGRVGAIIGGLVNAMRVHSPDAIAEQARVEERSRLSPELEKVVEERDWIHEQLRRVERRAAALEASVSSLGQQRDDARTALNELRPSVSAPLSPPSSRLPPPL